MKLFIYGTLKHGHCRQDMMKGEYLGPTRTAPKYQLLNCGAYPGLVSDGENSIAGELWDVDQKLIEYLDVIEGAPDLFARSEIELANGENAVSYIYQGDVESLEDCGIAWDGC